MNVSRAQQRPSSVWCLLQQPPDPTTQQPTQPVPSPWTPGQGHPKTAHLPLEGPAWALPTLPPTPSLLLGAHSQPSHLESGYSLEQTLCLHAGGEGLARHGRLPNLVAVQAWTGHQPGPTWRDAREDLLCHTQLSTTWRISVQRGMWGPQKSHLGGSLWVLDA